VNLQYQLTKADKAAVPASFHDNASHYLGYREEDLRRPYARYFQPKAIPVQPHVHDALIAGPQAAAFGSRLSTLATEMSRPGYLPMETGYTVNDDGHLVVAVLTHMPGVTAEMWDWWAWWHAVEPARYKLWHPEAHLCAAYAEDRSGIKGLTDRQRYRGNSCYIDEYIGHERAPLRGSFFEPTLLGFAPEKPGETIVAARGGVSVLPLAAAWLVHQVRPTEDGCEMRSRFILNDLKVLGQPARSVTSLAGKLMCLPGINALSGLVMNRARPAQLHVEGPAMLYHCAQEMNHLASFLPQLYSEFAADSRP
jgi:DAPG hydrolase PhiG domain